jgi:hypothetical protein
MPAHPAKPAATTPGQPPHGIPGRPAPAIRPNRETLAATNQSRYRLSSSMNAASMLYAPDGETPGARIGGHSSMLKAQEHQEQGLRLPRHDQLSRAALRENDISAVPPAQGPRSRAATGS